MRVIRVVNREAAEGGERVKNDWRDEVLEGGVVERGAEGERKVRS